MSEIKSETTGLSSKRVRFVQEYLIDPNATQAAVKAGYSPNSAMVQGHRLLRDDKVAAAIVAGQARIAKAAEITQERVARGLLREAELYVGETDNPRQGAGARVQAWQHLGRYVGMFEDRLRLQGDPESPVVFNLRLADGLPHQKPPTIEHEPDVD